MYKTSKFYEYLKMKLTQTVVLSFVYLTCFLYDSNYPESNSQLITLRMMQLSVYLVDVILENFYPQILYSCKKMIIRTSIMIRKQRLCVIFKLEITNS